MPKQGTKKQAPQVSSPADFKKSVYAELILPSGNVVLAKRPGLPALVAEGKVPNSLQDILKEAMSGKKGSERNTMKMFADLDSDQLANAVEFMDWVVIACMMRPKVHPVPEDEDDRDDELLYVDELEEVDKSFLVGWAFGGTSDVDRFLEKQEEFMGDLEAVQSVGSDAE